MSHPGNGPDTNPSGYQPGPPGQHGEAAQHGRPAQPGQYGQGAQHSQPAQPGQYGHGAEPGQPYQPFGQPGAPGQPAGGWMPPQGGATPYGQPEQKSGAATKVLLAVGGVLVALVAVGLLVTMLGAGDPEVGDCVANVAGEEVEVVDCDAAEAEGRIVGIDEQDLDYQEFMDQEVCLEFETAISAIWVGGDQAQPGTIYCAEPV